MRIRHGLVGATALIAIIAMSAVAQAGPIFLTGHDPDFHSQDSAGAAVLLSTGLNFAMGGLLNEYISSLRNSRMLHGGHAWL
jgi:hypothetical protein